LGKSTELVWKALWAHISAYRARNFSVNIILSDGEGAIAALSTRLNSEGIKVDPSGTGQHVPAVENKVRQVKERTRAHLCVLPFNLPLILLTWLVYFCVSRINMMPSHLRINPSPPRELYIGRKIEFTKDLRVGFGDYCQCFTPRSNTEKNSMKPRTEGAIALLPVGNLQGSVKFFNLSTSRVITRDHWYELPMPTQVIDHLNLLAAKEKRQLSKDPIFRIGTQQLLNEEIILNDSNNEDDEYIVQADTIFEEYIPPDITSTPGEDFQPSTPPDEQTDEPTSIIDQFSSSPPTIINAAENLTSPSDPSSNQPLEQPDEYENHRGVESPLILSEPNNDNTTTINKPYNLRTKPTVKRNKEFLYFSRHYSFHMSPNKAIQKFGKKTALTSIVKEINQLLEKDVFDPVAIENLSNRQIKRVIRSHAFIKEKFLADGTFDKLKTRVVAGGNLQERDLYDMYGDISSPTVSLTSVFILATIAAHECRKVVTVDIAGAYLNADLVTHEVLMKIDPVLSAILCSLCPKYKNYILEDGSVIVKLKKALYGCIESAKLWYDHISNTLIKDGFEANEYDICVFNKMVNGKQITLCIYVDDIMISSEDDYAIMSVIELLKNTYNTITVHEGNTHSYLGMQFEFINNSNNNSNDNNKSVKITMDGFVKDLLLQHTNGTETSVTPASPNLFKIRESPKLNKLKAEEFHSITAKLLYLAKRVRPDILPAVVFLTTRVNSSSDDDWSKLQRILRYLKGSDKFGIILEIDKEINIFSYIDAAYGVHHDYKSHTGGFISFGRGAIHVKSSKQKLNSKSSTESELIALSDYSTFVIWARNFLTSQGYASTQPAIIYQDNLSTMALIEKGRPASERTRHINIRYFFIKDKVQSGDIELKYLPTEEMVADILTKPLQGELFRIQRAKLLNWY
jgi:hypothetical protein